MSKPTPTMVQTLKAAGWTNAEIVSRAALARLPNAWHSSLRYSTVFEYDAIQAQIIKYKEAQGNLRQTGAIQFLHAMNHASNQFCRMTAPWFARRGPKLRDFIEWARI